MKIRTQYLLKGSAFNKLKITGDNFEILIKYSNIPPLQKRIDTLLEKIKNDNEENEVI